jgi:hypothetical protein
MAILFNGVLGTCVYAAESIDVANEGLTGGNEEGSSSPGALEVPPGHTMDPTLGVPVLIFLFFYFMFAKPEVC